MQPQGKKMKSSNFTQFLAEIGGGVQEQMLCRLLSEVATAVHDKGAAGEINIKLKIKPPKMAHPAGATVSVEHTVKYTRPTMRGDASETDVSQTPFHINRDGTVTLFPKDQDDMINNMQKNTSEAKS